MPICKGMRVGAKCGQARKNPGQQSWPGLMAGMTPMPSGFAKGEINRLAVRRKQVIAPGLYRDWLPGWCLKIQTDSG